jgi:predicted transcriptional regulator
MCLEAGLTPAALAERVGAPRQVVADLEAGKIEPWSDWIERVAAALGRRLRDCAEQ